MSNQETTFEVGERVLVHQGYHGEDIRKISSITPAGNYKIGKAIYNKFGYLKGGGSWEVSFIEKLTPEKENELIRKAKIYAIQNYDGWEKLDDLVINWVFDTIKSKVK